MTGRGLAIAAASALTVALIAAVARPLLAGPHSGRQVQPSGTASIPVDINRVATRAARTDLRCRPQPQSQPTPRAQGDCGALHVTRHQTRCSNSSQCTVELIGDLKTDSLDVPIALTVTVIHAASTWRVLEVAS